MYPTAETRRNFRKRVVPVPWRRGKRRSGVENGAAACEIHATVYVCASAACECAKAECENAKAECECVRVMCECIKAHLKKSVAGLKSPLRRANVSE
jgi:hypothetical protein